MNKPDCVVHYEEMLDAGMNIYLDPIEIDEIFHYYAEQNDINKMIPLVELAKRLHPTSEMVLAAEAELALNLNDFEGCLRILTPIFDDQQMFHFVLRSACYAGLQERDKALEDARMAMQLAESDTRQMRAFVAYDLGLGFSNAFMHEDAVSFLLSSEELDPNDLRNLSCLANSYKGMGELQQALRYADRCLEVDPYYLDAWVMKAGIYFDQNEVDKAIDCYDYALAIDPDNVDIKVFKAITLGRAQRYEEARYLLLEVQDKVSEPAQLSDLSIMLGRIALEADHDKQVACEYAWKSIRANALESLVIARAAAMMDEMEMLDDAVAAYKQAYALDNNDEQVLSHLADVCMRAGRTEDAHRYYQILYDKRPTMQNSVLWAIALMGMDKVAVALHVLQEMSERERLVPWHVFAIMAICAFQMSEIALSKDYARIAYDRAPESTISLFQTMQPEFYDYLKKHRAFSRWNSSRTERLERLEALLISNDKKLEQMTFDLRQALHGSAK